MYDACMTHLFSPEVSTGPHIHPLELQAIVLTETYSMMFRAALLNQQTQRFQSPCASSVWLVAGLAVGAGCHAVQLRHNRVIRWRVVKTIEFAQCEHRRLHREFS
jgi:phosphate/sulfate permease